MKLIFRVGDWMATNEGIFRRVKYVNGTYVWHQWDPVFTWCKKESE